MSTPEKENTRVKPCYVLLEPITPKVNVEFSAELKRVINERNILTTKTRKRVTEALEEIQYETQESSRRIKRQNILAEILESEENYIRQLEIIIEFFIKPVKERHLLKPKDIDLLFGNIHSIYKINKELLNELRKGPENVANAFSSIAPFFKCYSFYAFEFKKSLEILQNCHRDNPKFAKFLEMQESRPEVQSKLSALLIAPIQRVPRYKLLLKPLFNIASPSERDYEILLDSLIKVENAADHINKIIQERENMQKLIEFQRCLQTGEPNVITPGRNFIKEGTLMRISPKNGHSDKLHVVLTNDIIIFCKMKKDELKVNSLKCLGIFPLMKCKVQEVLDKGAFKMICQNEDIVLYHESFSETVKWIDEIKIAIETLLDDRKTLKKESTVRRPVKRKNLKEYNEVGLSPGKKLRKRKNPFETENTDSKPVVLSKRRPIRDRSSNLLHNENNDIVPSFFVTLKPEVSEKLEVKEDSHQAITNEKKDDETQSSLNNEISKDVFVFGNPQPDRGFSFKMNQWLCGIGSSVKKFFGFK